MRVRRALHVELSSWIVHSCLQLVGNVCNLHSCIVMHVVRNDCHLQDGLLDALDTICLQPRHGLHLDRDNTWLWRHDLQDNLLEPLLNC
jgi:hypothetical protein